MEWSVKLPPPADPMATAFRNLRANALTRPCLRKEDVVSYCHRLELPGKAIWLGVYRRCDLFDGWPAWHATLAVYMDRRVRPVKDIGSAQRKRLLALMAECLGPVGEPPDVVTATERALHLSRLLSAEESDALLVNGVGMLPLLS